MTSQYGAYALRAGLARLYTRIRMHTPTRLGTHMHARTHAFRRQIVKCLNVRKMIVTEFVEKKSNTHVYCAV